MSGIEWQRKVIIRENGEKESVGKYVRKRPFVL